MDIRNNLADPNVTMELHALGFYNALERIQDLLESELTTEQVIDYCKGKRIELEGEYGWK